MENQAEQQVVKKENGFKRFLKAVFVHNAGYKVLALVVSAALWVLAVALG